MYGASAGNSLGSSGADIGREPRWPAPTWKFGLTYVERHL